jgi:hypothetical protein
MPVDLGAVKAPKLKTSVALPEDVQREAYEVARQHGLSLSEYVVRLLRVDLAERRAVREENL